MFIGHIDELSTRFVNSGVILYTSVDSRLYGRLFTLPVYKGHLDGPVNTHSNQNVLSMKAEA